jgi:hypothetical protein
MSHDRPASQLFFEVLTPLDFTVRVSKSYWQIITTIKHPVMAGREADVQATLFQPDTIRQSRSDTAVLLQNRTPWTVDMCSR